MKRYPYGQILLWYMIRITFFYVFAVLLGAGLLQARPADAQALKQRVALHITNKSIPQVLRQIERQTGIRFSYANNLLDGGGKVDLDVQQQPVEDVLQQLLTPLAIQYEEKDRGYVVLRKREGNNEKKAGDVDRVKAVGIDRLIEQQFAVTGTVVSAKSNRPIAGATVTNKRTRIHSVTDRLGEYRIPARTDDILIYSFVGYQTTEEKVGGRDWITVSLDSAETTLEEVEINAGYYTTTRRTSTGNISRVSGEEIQRQPVSNPLAALHGRMPGVHVEQSAGLPGSHFRISVRGRNSIRTDGNDPLYIIDGVPFPAQTLSVGLSSDVLPSPSPLSSIDPSNIASIEILKDADATAIYGSRGSNGVILITTKKGRSGRTETNVGYSSGIGNVAKAIQLLNTQQYVAMRKEAFANDGVTPTLSNAPDLVLWDTTRYTDWQKVLLGGTSHRNNVQAAISGGNNTTQFLLRGNFYRETTVLPKDLAYVRRLGHFNVSHSPENKRLRADFSVTLSSDNNNLIYNNLAAVSRTLPPNAPPLYDEAGNLNWENSSWTNPLSLLERTYRNGTDNMIANGIVHYGILPDLWVKANFGYSFLQMREIGTFPKTSYDPASNNQSFAQFGNNSLKTWIVEPQLTYHTNIGKGDIHFLLGTSFQESSGESGSMLASGFSNDALIESPQAASALSSTRSYSQYRYNALFGRVHFNWADKYVFNLTGRRDGSSRFGPGKRFGNFGALGMAWLFSEEKIFNDKLSFLNLGKIRASYGVSGSDQIGDYAYMDTHSSTSPTTQYQGPGLIPTRLVNPDYAWESTRKLEAGMELEFLRNRIFLAISWYSTRSSDQLVGLPLPGLTGFTSVQFNLPATVRNLGWEFELRTTNVRTGTFSWSSGLNLTIPKNKLVDYPNLHISPYRNSLMIGEPLTISKSYRSSGVNPENGLYGFVEESGAPYPSNSSIPAASKYLPIFSGQTAFGGIQNSILLKNVSLDFHFHWVKQIRTSYLSSFGRPGLLGNQPVEVLNRWQKPGDITHIQRYGTNVATLFTHLNWKGSEEVIGTDLSFLRLKNVSLSWNLPAEWCNKLGLEYARLYVQGQNLLTISATSIDPESVVNNVPPLRVFLGGIEITF